MAQTSRDQNAVKNIALVGGGGQLGSYILTSLLATGRHSITVLTRGESKSTFPAHPSLKTTHIDYSTPASLTVALQGQDVLIITMAVTAPPDQEESLIRAAAEANVKYVIPNEWGHDLSHEGLAKDTPILGPKLGISRKLIEGLGVSKWLVVTGGFWYEFSLAGTEWRYGFDFKEKRVTFYGDGTVKINTSTWEQFAGAVAALLSLPILPRDGDDASTTLSNFFNKPCFISSFLVSQKDMFESVLRVTGDKESDWTITYEDAVARWKKGMELFQQGNRLGFGIAMYARDFFDDGAGDFETRHGLSNDVLGLPKEDFDACTAKAVERAEKMASADHAFRD
ncbi:putative oxidoreductase CipA [Leptodontidium sp. MPI-SDFR-AT-0119]|nr:putative oxidoreductase CipA [Leptodontidium sp. MPI-SDFR-AT-0119]